MRQYTSADYDRQAAVDARTASSNREHSLEQRVEKLEREMIDAADAIDILRQYITDVDLRTGEAE